MENYRMSVSIEADNSKLKKKASDSVTTTKKMVKEIDDETKKIKYPTDGGGATIKKSAGETTSTVKKMVNEINADVGRIKTPADAFAATEAHGDFAKMKAVMKSMVNDMASGDIYRGVVAEIREYNKQAAIAAGIRVYTDDYVQISQDVSALEQELQDLTAKKEEMENSGASTTYTDDYKDTLDYMKKLQDQAGKLKEKLDSGKGGKNTAQLQEDYEEALNGVKALRSELRDLEASGQKMTETEEFRALKDNIQGTTEALNAYRAAKSGMEDSGTDTKATSFANSGNIAAAGAVMRQAYEGVREKIKEASQATSEFLQRIPVVGKMAADAAYLGSKAFAGMRAAASRVAPVIKKAGGAAASLIKRFSSGIPTVRSFFKGAGGNSGGGIGQSLKTIIKYTLGIRSLFALMRKLRSAIADGFKNLAQYSSSTNNSLSTLQSGLNAVKNSLATAFAPVLNAVAPALNTLIDWLIGAANAVAHFMAALTGQSTYVVAKRAATDYAGSLGNQAAAANDAADAQKELNRSLMGFDEINKLDDNSSSSGSGGSGGGGGGGGAGDMFSTETVTSGFQDLAKLVRESWENADFTEIGNILGTKLRDGLNSIDWGPIQATAQKVGKSFATLINGFVEVEGLGESIGKTVGQALNTGIMGAEAFVTNLHFDSVGGFIAEAMNAAVETVKWDTLGSTVAAGINGVFTALKTWSGKFDFGAAGTAVKTALNSALTGINWSEAITAATQIGSGIAKALNNVITPDTLGNIGETLANAFNTKLAWASGFVKEADWSTWGSSVASGINAYFKTINWTELGVTFTEAATGLFNMLTSAITDTDWKGIGKDIATAVAAVDWSAIFTSASKGIGAAFGGLAAFVAGLVEDAFGSIKDYFTGKIEESGGNIVLGIFNGILDGVKGIGAWIVDNIFRPFIDGFKSAFGIHSPASTMEEPGKNIVLGILEGIINGLANIVSWVNTNIVTPIKNAIKTAWKAAGVIVELGVSLIRKGWETVTGWLGTLGAAAKAAIEAAVSLVKKAGAWAADAWKAISSGVENITKTLIAETKEKVAGALNTIKTGWANIKDKAATLVAEAKEKVAGAINTIKSGWANISSKAATLVAEAKEKVAGAINTIKSGWANISSKAATLVAEAKEKVAGAINTIKSGWANISSKTATLVAEAKEKVAGALNTLKSSWANVSTKAVTLVAEAKEKVAGALGNLKESWNSFKDKTVEVAVSIINAAKSWWQSVVNFWTGETSGKSLSASVEVEPSGPSEGGAKGSFGTGIETTATITHVTYDIPEEEKNFGVHIVGTDLRWKDNKTPSKEIDTTTGTPTWSKGKPSKEIDTTTGTPTWSKGKPSKEIDTTTGTPTWSKGKPSKEIDTETGSPAWKKGVTPTKGIKTETGSPAWKKGVTPTKGIKTETGSPEWKKGVTPSKEINTTTGTPTWSNGVPTKGINTETGAPSWVNNKVPTKTINFYLGEQQNTPTVTVKPRYAGPQEAGGGVYEHGTWRPVTAAASGGSFNEGQFFLARERGPELVSSINGKTAVMNNDQIVASVSAGVARAVASVMHTSKGTQAPVVYVMIGDHEVTDVVVKDINERTIQTGKCPVIV